MKRFSSDVFPIEEIAIGGTVEQIVKGGRDKFPLLEDGFQGINQIGVIGWGSQGPAQAQNLRDSLEGTGIKVKVGLRSGSKSLDEARGAGFTEENGTLGEMFKVIAESDLVILLISDAAQVEHYERIFATMKHGAMLGLSHGFLLGYFDSLGFRVKNPFPNYISVIGVCPKGMGPSVRRLYEQGKEINGAGINCSFTVEQDIDGRATDVALAWAIAIGAPYVFPTTLRNEYRSDIFGERAVLLGGIEGATEALYPYYMEGGMNEEDAFRNAVEHLTGPISSVISKQGIIGLYNMFIAKDKEMFERAYSSAILPFYVLMNEIYDEVSSGNEINSVVMAGERLKEFGWTKIDGTRMWTVGKKVRSQRGKSGSSYENMISPVTAGIYSAMMMAQVTVLHEHGHCLSEICNETVIEAVDSLNPYIHAQGIAYMVDNCSTTARLGDRKWAPRFHHVIMQQVLVNLDSGKEIDHTLINDFKNHFIHGALATCATMRPPVDISVAAKQ